MTNGMILNECLAAIRALQEDNKQLRSKLEFMEVLLKGTREDPGHYDANDDPSNFGV